MSLILSLFVFQACETTGEDTPDGEDPQQLPELADLVGRWGIFETIDDQGNRESSVPCRNTLEIHSSGDFLYVDASHGEWLEGNVQFNSADSSLQLSANGRVTLLKLSSMAEGNLEFRVEDHEGGAVRVNTQRFTLLEGEDCASFTSESITQKWSISAFSHAIYDGENLLEERSGEDLKENLYTIEFKSDGTALTIDLINDFNFEQGAFRMIDNHNLVLDFDFEDDDPGSLVHLKNVQWPYWIFESVEYGIDERSGEEVRMVRTFNLVANSGNEPAFGSEELPGQWQITEVEVLRQQEPGEENEGPVVGMMLNFGTDGTGQVSMQGTEVTGLAYEMLDMSNLLVSFEDEENGNEEENNFSVFHVNAKSDGAIELIIFAPRREMESQHSGEHGGGPEFRILMEKQ